MFSYSTPVVTPSLVERAIRFLALSAWPRDDLLIAVGVCGVLLGIVIGGIGVLVGLQVLGKKGVFIGSDGAAPVSVNVHQSINGAETGAGSSVPAAATSMDFEPASHRLARLRRGGGSLA